MKKKRNPLGYFGWMGIIGVTGFLLGAPALHIFFLFFFFFTYAGMTPDEMRAASLVTDKLVTIPTGVYSQMLLMQTLLLWTVAILLSVFIFTLIYFSHKEKKYAGEDDPC